MNKKFLPVVIIGIAIIFALAGFAAGIEYQKRKLLSKSSNTQNFPGGNGNQASINTRQRGGLQGGMAAGDVIAKNANSITLKMRDGSSRIVFFSDSTQITKQVAGTLDDVIIGSSVMIQGTSNSDGSITAQVISLRSTDSSINTGNISGNQQDSGTINQPSVNPSASGDDNSQDQQN